MSITAPKLNTGLNLSDLSFEDQQVVRKSTLEIKLLTRNTVNNAIEMGKNLVAVKGVLGHGCFRQWLDSEFPGGNSTAAKLMRVYQAFNAVDISSMNIALTALYQLSSSSTPHSAVDEALARAVRGECITPRVANDIIAKHKEHSIDVDAVESSDPDLNDVTRHCCENSGAIQLVNLEFEYSSSLSKGKPLNLRCTIRYPGPQEDIRLLLTQIFDRREFFDSSLKQAKALSSNVHEMYI